MLALPWSATIRGLIAPGGSSSIFSAATASVTVATTSNRVICWKSPQATILREYQSTTTKRNQKRLAILTHVQSIPQRRFGAHGSWRRISAGGSVGFLIPRINSWLSPCFLRISATVDLPTKATAFLSREYAILRQR